VFFARLDRLGVLAPWRFIVIRCVSFGSHWVRVKTEGS
jgi:hypothetical protein